MGMEHISTDHWRHCCVLENVSGDLVQPKPSSSTLILCTYVTSEQKPMKLITDMRELEKVLDVSAFKM